MAPEPRPRYRCPQCHESDGLWEGVDVPGWRGIDEQLQPHGQRDEDWTFAEPNGDLGCRCGWEGSVSGLERLGIDGEPLTPVHRNQLHFAA